MRQPFPLLRLPLLALEPVLKNMPPTELLNLALNSKRMQTLIRLGKTRDTKLKITVLTFFVKVDLVSNRGSHSICVRNHDSHVTHRIFDYDASSLYLTTLAKANRMVSFDRDLNGMYLVASWLSALFNCSFIGQLHWSRPCQKAYKEVTDWIKTRQVSIDSLELKSGEVNDLNRIQVTDSLFVTKAMLRGRVLAPTVREVYIEDGRFLNFPNLLAVSNCEKIQLARSLYTNDHVERFVRKWKDGGFPNLKYAIWKSARMDGDLRILGMKLPIGHHQDGPCEMINGVSIYPNNGYDIMSKNGIHAKLYVNQLTQLFFLYVTE